MERWWNLEVCVIVPFDTEKEAREAGSADVLDRFGEVAHEAFGDCREVVTGRIVEATDED